MRRVLFPTLSLGYVLLLGFFGRDINNFFHELITGEPYSVAPVNMTLVAMTTAIPPISCLLSLKSPLA